MERQVGTNCAGGAGSRVARRDAGAAARARGARAAAARAARAGTAAWRARAAAG